MKLLLTNDDGIIAPGIQALYHALSDDLHTPYDVTVVAPSSQRSAAGQSFTFGKSYTVAQIDQRHYRCTGTPTDCVMFGLTELGPFDAVLSGINQGANVGWDIWYSGTLGAAFEASRRQIPALALSLNVSPDMINTTTDSCYDAVAEQLRRYLSLNFLEVVRAGAVANLNFPNSRSFVGNRPRLTRPGAYAFNRQLLIRDKREQSSEWEVHIEHRERNIDRAMEEPDSDGALIYSGPTIGLLHLDWYYFPYEEERRLKQWVDQLP